MYGVVPVAIAQQIGKSHPRITSLKFDLKKHRSETLAALSHRNSTAALSLLCTQARVTLSQLCGLLSFPFSFTLKG